MNNKQLYFKDNSKSVRIITYGRNNNFKPAVFASEKNIVSGTSDEKQLSLRLSEMGKANAQLKILLEERTSKLSEVVATNAKFLSILAHDLRSPFQSIIGALDLLQDSYIENDEVEIESYLLMANNSANATLRLLENLLSWTSLQNTEKNFNPVKVDVNQVILAEIESLKPSATQKLITFNHTIKPSLYAIADLQMVKTILRNLINNAIKYSYLGGEIKINVAKKDRFVEIEIKDYGVGFTQNALKELFQRNELHTTRGTKNEHGTGLGLTICKEFVEINGGFIWIESESGKGSKISFSLPHQL